MSKAMEIGRMYRCARRPHGPGTVLFAASAAAAAEVYALWMFSATAEDRVTEVCVFDDGAPMQRFDIVASWAPTFRAVPR